MKNLGLFFLMIITLAACDNNKLPEGVISKEEMINVSIDLQILESKIDSRVKGKEKQKAYFTALQGEVYKKHGIDSTAYAQSFDYYMARLDDSREIYKAVNDSVVTLRNLDRDAKIKKRKEKKLPKKK